MADLYQNLSYDEYKELELQCRAFGETEHGEGSEWYHKSFRLTVAGQTTDHTVHYTHRQRLNAPKKRI